MARILFMLLAAAIAMNAGILIGARYGASIQNGSYDGHSAKDDDKKPWGAGVVLGYELDQYRFVASLDDFDIDKKSTLVTLGAHMVDRSDERINGFFGIELGQLGYQLKDQPDKENMTLGGLTLGFILLDDRFPNMQMEIGYRYLKRFGSEPNKVKFDDMHHLSMGLYFNFDAF